MGGAESDWAWGLCFPSTSLRVQWAEGRGHNGKWPLSALMQLGLHAPESLSPPGSPPHLLHLGNLPLQPNAEQTTFPLSYTSFLKAKPED